MIATISSDTAAMPSDPTGSWKSQAPSLLTHRLQPYLMAYRTGIAWGSGRFFAIGPEGNIVHSSDGDH